MGSDTARHLYDLLNAGAVEQIGELVTEDYIEHDPIPGQGTGREGAVDRFTMLTSALAPHFTIEDIVSEGDRVVVRWTNDGTHVGEFAGIPATGAAFRIAGIDIYRLEGERLAEHWHVVDQLAMLAQLGLLPQPA
ncbi:MAG TPA: ester cyclase [Candidatus Nanopelagicales bacterium]|nr:ester cyclase [Candidatus Nanopelagicales bacterium]